MPLDLPADVSAAPATAIVAPAPKSQPIHVDSNGFHYVVNGNLWLSEDAVREAIERAKTPQEAVQFLDAAYKRTPYFLVALRGETRDKLVAIQVFNGRITSVDGPPELASYFDGVFGYGGVLDRTDVQRNDMIRAAAGVETYLSRQGMRPKINLKAGQESGTTTLVVAEEPIPEAKPWNANVAFGNLGSRYSSRYLVTAAGSLRPGGGLELTANVGHGLPGMTADSGGAQYDTAGVGATIATPLGIYGASFSGISYKVGESSAPLYPTGDINTVALTGAQLVFADETKRLTLSEGWTQVDNVVDVFGGEFNLTDQHYAYLTLGTAYNQQFAVLGRPGNVVASLTAQKGISPRTGTFQPPGNGIPDTYFGLLQASVSYQQALPWNLTATATLNAQFADSTVPQNQQWVVGGFGNLTAWLPAVLVGDSGALARLAVASPTQAWQGYSMSASGFVEAGGVKAHYTAPNTPVTRTLADAGISLQGNTPFGTSLIVGYAWPIYSRNVDREAVDRQYRANVYFSLTQSF
ncbi:MAG: ShlB/FhaC/HecB family hemolysin secretion/activation protein [Burkholderiales bacterium]